MSLTSEYLKIRKHRDQAKQSSVSDVSTVGNGRTAGKDDYTQSYLAARAKRDSGQKWLEDSANLIKSIGNSSGSWFDQSHYESQNAQISNMISQADTWRTKYAGNQEAISSIDSVVDALNSTKDYITGYYDHYAQWDSAEAYNTAMKQAQEFSDEHGTLESRQAWYSEQQAKVAVLDSYYNNYYTIQLQYQDLMANPEAYTPQERQDILDKYEMHQAYSQEYDSLKDVENEIDAIETELRNYERGNYNEFGQFYGSKVVDDYYHVTQNADFDTVSANRNYTNPSIDEYAQTPDYLDQNAWYWEDGVLYDAQGEAQETDAFGNWIDPRNKDWLIEDKLGLFLNATEEQRNQAAAGNWGINNVSATFREGLERDWKYLQDWEIGVYYYYLEESQEKAYQYLSDMERELNRRRALDEIGQWDKSYNEATFLDKLGMNLATFPAKFLSTIGGTVDNVNHVLRGEDINPYSTAHTGMRYSQVVRGNTAEELDATGFKMPVVEFTLGDIYQTGMSRIDSALATSIFGGGGTVFLGMGAAQEEAYRLYQEGASAEQITLGSFAAGAAEAVWEYISFGKLKEIEDVGSLKKWVKSVLVQGWNEAGEEALTEATNILTNAIVMGGQSDLAELYKENKESAFRTFVDLAQQIAHSAFGGFLGGTGAGFSQATSEYVNTTSKYRDVGSQTIKEHISMAEFANSESPVWRNVAYEDTDTKTRIMQEMHDAMVTEGTVVKVSDAVASSVDQSFPDLRKIKKRDRTPILKKAMAELKNNLRQFLNGFKNQNIEFEVNGKILDAKLYNTGINEVLDKVTKQKAEMLYSTGEIFQNARYLYSTPDYAGDPNVYRWNYFYTPVQVGEEMVGVRVAVRDMVKGTDGVTPESQVYNWGIKKDASLDDGSHGQKAASSPVSSDALNNSISENALGVNGENVSALAAEKVDIEGYRSPFAQLKKERAVLQQAIDSMDTRPMNPRVYNELNAYSRQLQHLDTTQMLLDQKKSILQQQQASGAPLSQIQQTQTDIAKLEKMLAAQQQKLQKAQQSPALQKVIQKTRTEMDTQAAENSRKNVLDISRTFDRIKADSTMKKGAANQEQSVLDQSRTLTTKEILERINEFVDVQSLLGYQQRALNAYWQQTQILDDLETVRQEQETKLKKLQVKGASLGEMQQEENRYEGTIGEITKAKEALRRIEKRQGITTVVNKVKQRIYNKYQQTAQQVFALREKLDEQRIRQQEQRTELEMLQYSQTDSADMLRVEMRSRIAELDAKIIQTSEQLHSIENNLALEKAWASAIIDPADRRSLLFDDSKVMTVNGKHVIIIKNLFDPGFVDKKGKSNLDRIAKGLSPYGVDGKLLNVHHLDQTDNSIVVAIPGSLHQKYDSMLHSNKGHAPSQIDRTAFNNWRYSYWKWVSQQFIEQTEDSYELSGP